MSKRCELQKEYYQEHGNYKGEGKYCDKYVSWLEDQILALRIHDCSIVKRTEMKVENLKYLLRYGQDAMTVMQIADALKEAHQLIEKAQKMEHLLKEIQLYETDSNDAWLTNVLKMIDEALTQ